MSKPIWKDAIGASKKPRRLKLVQQVDGLYVCPVDSCDSEPYRSQRGCRNHVYKRHGWFYYFDVKPDAQTVLPEYHTRMRPYELPRKSRTSSMPMFAKDCRLAKSFKTWLTSPGGGGKQMSQAEQLACKVLKYAKFCCNDLSATWEIPLNVIDYCIGCVTMLSDFVTYLQTEWKMGYSGLIGYMNAIGHMLDYRRSAGTCARNIPVFIASEIYLDRVKKFLRRKMKIEWNTLLSVEYLNSINCWATLEDLQKVIPHHTDRYKEIAINARNQLHFVPAHDLSFATAFIVAVLFLMVKASRPMTYQYLTVDMVKSVGSSGLIDQTTFKTNQKYGFDSLLFSADVTTLINSYIDCIRIRLNPVCNYVLICRNGKQLSQLSDIFGRIVYQAIGKYINPTRYRQIIESRSAELLSVDDQIVLSKDQKHTSNVAKVHYQKLQSRCIAEKARTCMDKLRDDSLSAGSISDINTCLDVSDFTVTARCHIEKAVTNEETTNRRQKKLAFTTQEDKFLLDGLKKHGCGKWTSILHDTCYTFHPTRKASTLAVRARNRKFVK